MSDRRRNIAYVRRSGRGLVLERRGPDGRIYFAVGAEGWNVLRASD